MRINTLTFDANLPTKQQVNVPTNTDYKIGMKFKKDGETQAVPTTAVKLVYGDTTLSADVEKTNGYVTFTRSSGDNASCKEYTVDVDTTDYTTIHGGTKRTSSSLLMDNFYLSSYPELSGQNIYGKNIRVLYSDAEDGDYKDINYTKMDPAFFVDFRDPVQTSISRYRWFGNSVQGGIPMDWRIMSYIGGVATIVDSIKIDTSVADRVIFYCQFNQVHTLSDVCPDFVGTPSASNPIWIKLVIKVGDLPLIAKFKLVENVYKSQSGDINVQNDPDFSTAKVEGTYEDGTEFSYDFCVQ